MIYTILLFIIFLIYFRLARKYSIVDVPNHRTMHEGSTIRGGGIAIAFAIIVCSVFIEIPGWIFTISLVVLSIVGFLDDIYDISLKIRLPAQILAIILILMELNLLGLNPILLILIVIVAAGILNAYNFMDGINGMTGGYSLVTLLSLLYINNTVQSFIPNSFLFFVLLAIFVFSIFNFRSKAICFAGDIGSLSIALIVIYLLIKLISETHQFGYLLFLTLYGIDTIFTIIQRIAMKENIFQAHRMHLFQVVVSKSGMPHIYMSIIYLVIQAIINFAIITTLTMTKEVQVSFLCVVLIIVSIIYIIVKKKFSPEIS